MKEHKWMVNTLIDIAGYAVKHDLKESHVALVNAIARVALEVGDGPETSASISASTQHMGAEIRLFQSS